MNEGGEEGGINFGVFPEPTRTLDGEVGEAGDDDGTDEEEHEVEDEEERLGGEGVRWGEEVAGDEDEEDEDCAGKEDALEEVLTGFDAGHFHVVEFFPS